MRSHGVPALLLMVAAPIAMASCAGSGADGPVTETDAKGGAVIQSPSAENPAAASSRGASTPAPSAAPSGYPADLPRAEGRASWILYPTLEEVIAEADLFIVGDVVSAAPGREAGATFPLPTTVSEIKIVDIAKGSSPTPGLVSVEQTGGIYRTTHAIEDARLSPAPLPPEAPTGAKPRDPGTPPDEMLLELADDPLLRPGERVALALRWVPELEVYRLVNPQGRFSITADSFVTPILSEDSAVRALAGRTVAELLGEVRLLAERTSRLGGGRRGAWGALTAGAAHSALGLRVARRI